MLIVINSLLLVSFLAVGIIGYGLIKENITEKSDQQLKTQTKYVGAKVESFFAEREVLLLDEARYLGGILKESNGDSSLLQNAKNVVGQRLVASLKQTKEKYGVIDVYIGYPNGSATCGSEWVSDDPNWKSYERPWYKAAIVQKENWFTLMFT